MESDSDSSKESIKNQITKVEVKQPDPKPRRKRKPMTENELAKLSEARKKALSVLSEQRNAKKREKEKAEREKESAQMKALRDEVEALRMKPVVKDEVKEKKIKKVIYESDSDEEIQVIRRKPKEVVKALPLEVKQSLTGHELLDKLFFQDR